jgi:hypothetical protein
MKECRVISKCKCKTCLGIGNFSISYPQVDYDATIPCKDCYALGVWYTGKNENKYRGYVGEFVATIDRGNFIKWLK